MPTGSLSRTITALGRHSERKNGGGTVLSAPPPLNFARRAGNGTRTRDPNLGKVVLYQLSYSRAGRNISVCVYPNNRNWWWVMGGWRWGAASPTTHPRPRITDYGLSPSACTAYHAVHASNPDNAASPPLNFACPSGVTISAANPPSSAARRNHCSTFDDSGPSNRAHSRASSPGGNVV